MSFFAGVPEAIGYKQIDESNSPYTLKSSDYLVGCSHNSSITINIPALSGVVTGKIYMIKDESGNASINNITLSCPEGEDIDGSNEITINGDYNSVEIYKGESGTSWHIK